MPYLNKASSFSNVHDIADGEISTLKCYIGSILEDLVPEISIGLIELILFLEMDALAFRTNVSP